MIRVYRTARQHRHRISFVALIASALMALFSTGPGAVSADVVISQIYGGGGNAGAQYRNDFVELFNRGATPVSLNGWSIQYTSATGTGNFSSNVTTLSGTLAPGQYYLVQLAAGTALSPVLPPPDAMGTTAVSATGGKVILANTSNGLACNGGSTPCDVTQRAQIIDLVGWDGANFFETTPAPATTNTTAVVRGAEGCTDTDNNADDFVAAAPGPRNTASPVAPCLLDLPPSLISAVPAHGMAGIALAADVTVIFSEPVTVSPAAFTITCTASGIHTFQLTGGPTMFTLNPDVNYLSSESCTLSVLAAQVSDVDETVQTMTSDVAITFSTIEVCGDPRTPIHIIQGSGLQSPLAGQQRSIEGIVTADYQAAGQLGGYFVQELEVDVDPATSEGIFVFNTSFPVSVGDKVHVRGSVVEFASSGGFLTELTDVAGALICSSGNPVPAPAAIALPVASVTTWEQFEGMLVSIPETLTVSDTFTLARFGEVWLSAGGRLLQPTNVVAPGVPAAVRQNLNDRSRILLDDANGQQNIDPTRYPTGGLSAANTLRVGDTVQNLTGVLEERFGDYRLQPLGPVAFAHTNPRPPSPAALGGTLRVASFNVLNYFNGDGLGGGFPTARGATTVAEFARQRAKTIAAITAIDADIIGLMELENDARGNSAIEDLVSGLNEAAAPGTYAFIDTGVVGTDEIRVALLYKPAVVATFNEFAVIDSSVDPDFIDTKNRPSLAQTFTQVANGERLTVVVNHLKSKGSDCLDVGDPDTGDGQGNCNVTRTKAAAALVKWLAGDPTSSGDGDVLLIGDMNSYAKEDPIGVMVDAGYADVIAEKVGAGGYSYVFDAQSGYLDHALASGGLAPRITSVLEWHINADEPIALDYNVEFKSANHVNTLYQDDPFRSSDHDPVVVGISLIEPYVWSGLFNPVSDAMRVNAGRTLPLKFSLGGNRGLEIFQSASPSSGQVACGNAHADEHEPTVTAGASGLKYDAANDQYTYTWKTDKKWAGTCRELVLDFVDGSRQTLTFTFTK